MSGATSVEELLDELFEEILGGAMPRAKTSRLARLVTLEHVDLLARKLAGVGDVQDHADRQGTSVPAQGFFRFVDLVAALVLSLGPEGSAAFGASPEATGPYVAWVERYTGDARFHPELRSSFPEVFAAR